MQRMCKNAYYYDHIMFMITIILCLVLRRFRVLFVRFLYDVPRCLRCCCMVCVRFPQVLYGLSTILYYFLNLCMVCVRLLDDLCMAFERFPQFVYGVSTMCVRLPKFVYGLRTCLYDFPRCVRIFCMAFVRCPLVVYGLRMC